MHNDQLLHHRGWCHESLSSIIRPYYVVWELWMYVLSLYTITGLSTKFSNCLQKGHTQTNLTSHYSMRICLMSCIFLHWNPSAMNIFNKLDICPLYTIISCNVASAALTVDSHFFMQTEFMCCSTHYTHTEIVTLFTWSGEVFIPFWCVLWGGCPSLQI